MNFNANLLLKNRKFLLQQIRVPYTCQIVYIYLIVVFSEMTATKLRYHDSIIPPNYFVNGVTKATSQEEKNVEADLCSANVVCFGGEEDFELIMRGDFAAFNRSDCALRFNEIFRWAWESWRAAVGNVIGTIYTKAIDIMNIGARANGTTLISFTILQTEWIIF